MAMKQSKAELSETKSLKRKHGAKRAKPWTAKPKPKKKAAKKK